MAKEVVFVGRRQVELREYAEPPLGPRDVRVTNLYSGISHGTSGRTTAATPSGTTNGWRMMALSPKADP